MTEAQSELAQREYQPSINDVGLQAPNRAQGFRSYFSAHGVQLVQRSEESEAFASLSLTSVGRAGAEITLGAAEVISEGSRATLRWPEVAIRYANDPSGLHQSITIDHSLAGKGLLELVLAVTDAQPQVGGNGVALISPNTVMQLGAIEALDATGLSLPLTIVASSGDASSGTIRLAVSDKSATYPIKLQSVLTGTNDALLQSNQQSAFLGCSVAGAGDVNGDGYADVIVGADSYNNGQDAEGAAFVYFGAANGRLVQAGQYRNSGTSPLQPWGLTQQSDGFTVKLNATSPRGRERAQLQLQVCPNGVPFGSLLCDNYVAANWTEIGANPQGTMLT